MLRVSGNAQQQVAKFNTLGLYSPVTEGRTDIDTRAGKTIVP